MRLLTLSNQGGLDGRYLISKIQPKEYYPASLITISTPHRGSPFMDWLMVSAIHASIKDTAA